MKYLKDVATIGIDAGKCRGCGICLSVCPRGVLTPRGGVVAVGDRDACIECGACKRNCPFEAVQVESGVGCAYAIFVGMIRGTPPSCGDDASECCSG